jgi:hypothetical protein
MTKKTFLGAMTVVTAVALTGTALVASNMGFKLNYSLQQLTGGQSLSGTSTLALPDNRQTGLNDAKGLMDDIGFASVTEVQRFLKASDSLQIYNGRKNGPGPNYLLNSGEGYRVKVLTTTNYIVVGSDNPAASYNFQQLTGGQSLSGTTEFAYNYHQTATDAKAMMDDIGFASVTEIQRFLKASDSLQIYNGRKNGPGPNFLLVPGESYRVKVLTTTNYIPSHY